MGTLRQNNTSTKQKGTTKPMATTKAPSLSSPSSVSEDLLSKVCAQRDRLESSLRDLIHTCNAIIAAHAFSKDKERYQQELMVRTLSSQKVLKEDHPERPRFDFASLPRISRKSSYDCTIIWFCRNLASLLLEFRVGDTFSQVKAKRIQKALDTIKYIAMDTLGRGHDWYDEEDLLESCIDEQVKSHWNHDFTKPMPFHYLVNELNRFTQSFSPLANYAWYEADVYRETQEALICACFTTAGIDPNDTYAVYKFLSSPPSPKDLIVM